MSEPILVPAGLAKHWENEARHAWSENARLKAELVKYRKDVTNSVDDLLDERARLKAEVERLISNNARLKEAIDDSYKAVDEMEKRMREWDEEILNVEIAKNAKLRDEIEQLKEAWVDKKMQEDRDAPLQQVERLTKVGDAMANVLCFTLGLSGEEPRFVKDWNAAKEGKQP